MFIPSTFKSGTWTVAREGEEIVLSVQENELSANEVPGGAVPQKKGAFKEIARRPCTKATLQGIHVCCVRQESGNTEASFLLRRLRLNADSFFSFKDAPKRSYWGWSLSVLAIASLIAGIVFAFNRRQRRFIY